MDANHVKDHAVEPPKTPLPEPDNDNITVLTSKLPNEPILPWNRYDSPWLESEASEEAAALEETAESPTETAAASEPAAVSEPVPNTAAPDDKSADPAGATSPTVSTPNPTATATPIAQLPFLANPDSEEHAPSPDPEGEAPEATPLPATNHYLIDLAFEGTTD